MRNLSRVTVLLLIFFWLGTTGIFSTNFIFATEKIDINTVPIEDLVKIIHIGESRARELISLRPFSSLDELTKIKGIGEARLRDIKEQGLAWVTPHQSEVQPEAKPQPNPELQPIEESEIQPEPKPITYPLAIVINELLPNPEGIPDAEGEWIEIFNQNNFEVLLSDWKITDTVGKITTYSLPKGTKIPPQGFLVLSRPTTKITLNNDGDGLKLIQPDGKIVDEVTYEKAPRGQSFNLVNSDWAWNTNLTPGAANFIPFAQPEEKTETELLKDKSATEPETKRELAAAGLQISKPSKSLFVLLIALALAISSGIIILVLKKKLSSTRA
ncbi:MAG: lamin tail domain-containing protein [Candidatus Nealsonbacteria bacterium]